MRSWMVIAAILAGAPAVAQDNGVPGLQPLDMGSVILGSQLLRQNLDRATGTDSGGPCRGQGCKARRRQGPPVRRAGAPAALADTRYVPDRAVTLRVQRQFVDFLRRQAGPAGADAMAKVFASQDLLAAWARQAAPDGMRPNDVADAMAEYWVTNWLIARGSMDAPPAQVRGVREQARRTLVTNARFAGLTSAQRQEMAEVVIYNTLVQGEAYRGAVTKGDAATKARLGDAAVARFRNEMGVDLRALALTDRGFLKRA